MAIVRPEHLDWCEVIDFVIEDVLNITVRHGGAKISFPYSKRAADRDPYTLMRIVFEHKRDLMTAEKIAAALEPPIPPIPFQRRK